MCGAKYTPTKEEIDQVCKIPRVISYKFKYHDPEEIESLANLGLARGITRYDARGKMTFCNFIYWYCMREIRAYFTLLSTKAYSITLSIWEYDEVIPSKVTTILEDKELADYLLKILTRRQLLIISLYIRGYRFSDIAKRLSRHKNAISRCYYRGINKLKDKCISIGILYE